MRFYSRASWIDNRSVVGTTPNLYDYAGNVLNTVAVDPLGGGADSYRSPSAPTAAAFRPCRRTRWTRGS